MANKASLRRLKFSNFKLDTILDVTRAINDNLSIKRLLEQFESVLKDKLSIGKILLFSYADEWKTLLSSGVSNEIKDAIDVENDLQIFEEITTATSAQIDSLMPFDVIIPVFHNNRALAYLIIGDLDEETEGMSPTIRHLHFIQTITNIILVAVENKRLYKESLEQEAFRKELELASKLQTMLIPNADTAPRNNKLYIDAYYLPHYIIGGDYYDFLTLSETEVGFCIADVSGKGISGALVMSNIQANLRALFTPDISLSKLVYRLNEIVMHNTRGDKFVTMFIAKYNTVTRTLNYINAGHNPPVYYQPESKKMGTLTQGTTGLAMLDELPFLNEGVLQIDEPTRLLCFTDGLAEICNSDREEIGLKAVEETIVEKDNITDLMQSLLTDLAISRTNPRVFDDVTMLGVDFFVEE